MKLYSLVQEFEGLDPEEKLECLVELADELPAVAAERIGVHPPECRVQECQTPVYLWVEVRDGAVHLEADVPPRSPTVRGLVTLVVQGLEGASPADVASMPDDLVGLLDLGKTLGMTRQQGMRGLVARVKREVNRAAQSVKGTG